jgi:hypothetical protein
VLRSDRSDVVLTPYETVHIIKVRTFRDQEVDLTRVAALSTVTVRIAGSIATRNGHRFN